jgi:hypothetical protein
MTNYNWLPFDLLLIILTFTLAFTQVWFIGGFGWFLLLALSPNAHKR